MGTFSDWQRGQNAAEKDMESYSEFVKDIDMVVMD